jgi:hypothetical protein
VEFDPSNIRLLQELFLYQLTHLDRRFRVLPVHLHPAPTGATNQKMRERADKIIEKMSHAGPRMSLNFVSVDGNEGYNDYFQAMFNLLLHLLDRAEFGTSFRDFVLVQLRFWINDWFHLMKNARVQLFGKKLSSIHKTSRPGLPWMGLPSLSRNRRRLPITVHWVTVTLLICSPDDSPMFSFSEERI